MTPSLNHEISTALQGVLLNSFQRVVERQALLDEVAQTVRSSDPPFVPALPNVMAAVEGLAFQTGVERHLRVFNPSDTELRAGQVVHTIGANESGATVALVGSEDVINDPLGVVSQDIPERHPGYITVQGTVGALDTSEWGDGARLYLDSTRGGMVTTIPEEGAVTPIGVVIRSHETEGSIMVGGNIAGGPITVDSDLDQQVLRFVDGFWELEDF